MIRYPLIVCSYIVIAALMGWASRISRRRYFYFFFCISLLSTLPIAASPAQDRNLIFVSLGMAGVIAIILLTVLDKQPVKFNKAVLNSAITLFLII